MRPMPILMSVLAASLACGGAHSEEVIKIIVPFAAGGPVDTMARLMANEMAPILGKTVIVDDRGGAGADFKARIEHDTAFWREMIPKLGITISGEAK